MRTLGWLVLLVGCSTLLALSTSCGPTTTPSSSTLIGAFQVTGTLQSNTCAPGLNPVSPTTFSARLSVDGDVSTWATGTVSVNGTARGNTFHVVARTSTTVFTGCTLDQTETIDGTYLLMPTDAGSPDAGPTHSATISGMDTITVSTTSGAACLNVLIANGGTFPMIPCTATFTFTGRTD
jgi:hypothetical protein